MAECEMYKEERDTLEKEMREVNEGGMNLFEALDNREKTIAILGDRCGPKTAKQDGDIYVEGSCVIYRRNVMSA